MKKGFTLIELLGVIVLLGVLALISVPIIDSSLNKSKTNLGETQKKQIIKGAKEMFALVDNETGYLMYNYCLPGREESELKTKCSLYKSGETGFTYTLQNTTVNKVIVTLKIVQDNGFLPTDIKDPKTSLTYNPTTTLIEITKDTNGYSYDVKCQGDNCFYDE